MDIETIKAINDSPYMFCANITGGGTSFLSKYLAVKGGSNTLLNGSIPYGYSAIDDIIGYSPDRYCTDSVAKDLCLKAYEKAHKYLQGEEDKLPVGIGVSCSIASYGERKGRNHRFYIHIHTKLKTVKLSLILEQGMSREKEEELCRDLILSSLAKCCNLKRDVTCLNLINRSKTVIDYKIEDFSTPENLYDFKLINLAKGFAEKHKDEITVFPGSYNPLHDAHKQMVEMVLKQYPDQFIVHEICLGNIDKPTIDCEDISKRFAQFDQGKLILTDHTCARFIFKYDFFHQNYKKVNFVMGYDTYERLLDDPEIKVLAALMKMRGEKIFVFGKIKEIRKPHCGEEVFEFFEFESDIRSSKIRMEKEL